MKFSPIQSRMWSRLGSCGAYGLALIDAAQEDERVVALTADLRFYSGLERYALKYSERFYNFGIAEQDMISAAAGMAKEGLIPFASTYGTFASMRVTDQVRVAMGYMNLPVKLVGLTSGLSVGILGPTHISLEDIAIMRAIPNIVILSPADCTETCKAVLAASKIDAPVYIRLTGTQNNPVVYNDDYNFEIGKNISVREGSDIVIFATGTMVNKSLEASKILEAQIGCSVAVIDVHTIMPLDTKSIDENLSADLIVTVEEHGVIGGLGSAIAEYLALKKNKPVHLLIGCERKYEHAGSYEYLLNQYGLTSKQIADNISKIWEKL